MFSQFFISRPKFAFVISIVIVIAGLVAIQNLPIAQFPNIVPPQVSLTTSFPGADAETVEKTVVIPLEQQINGVENMIYMQTFCSDSGNVNLIVTFDVGSNNDINTVNVQNLGLIANSQMPPEVMNQGITVQQKSSNILQIITFYSPENKFDSVFLSNFASLNLLDEVARVPGVGQAMVLGSLNYSMRIWLKPDKMASLKVTVDDVLNAVQTQNKQIASGQIGGPPSVNGQQFQYTLLTQSRLEKVEEFGKVIIRANKTGGIIRLRDVATINLGAQTYSSFGQLNGKPAANLAIYQLPGANAIKVAQEVKKTLKKLSENYPKGIAAEVMYDTTEFVYASIKEVVKTLFIAIILVILVVFIFLQDWRATMIPTIAIPVSIIGTFAVMLAIGYSINTITLFGMILAIGIVVDDAIVVIENVFRIMETEGLSPVEATRKTMTQVTGPIVATTMVLMAVFVPIAFIPGITGELYRQFAITIAVSVGLSAINALTLSPALCATFLKPKVEGKEFFLFKWFNIFFEHITKRYNKYVAVTVRNLAAVIIFTLVLLGMIYVLYIFLPTGFIPNEDQGKVMVELKLPSGASLDRTAETTAKATEILRSIKGVDDVIVINGFSMLNQTNTSNVALIVVNLDSWDKRKTKDLQMAALFFKIRAKLNAGITNAACIVFQLPPITGLGTSGGFQFEIQQTQGNDPQKLAQVVRDFVYTANKQPELTNLATTYRANTPKTKVIIDKEKAEKLAVPLDQVFTTIQTYFGSTYVNLFNKFGKVYQVTLQAAPEYRGNVYDLYNIYVQNKMQGLVPLGTFIKTKTVLGPDIISHYNMFASAEINGAPAPGYSSGQAIAAMERVAKEVLPQGMSYEWTGTAYQEILAGNMVLVIFALAIIFIYLFLVAKYESWMLSLAVMLSVPVAILGALIALWIAGIANNIYAQVGFVLLFGMSSKTAILMVEFAREQHKSGLSIVEAAEHAAHMRFRAVVMTALAFVLGVFPLVIATGPGAISRQSLGVAVFGGMILDAILGTLRIPSFYVIIEKLIEWNWGRKEINAAAAIEPSVHKGE